MAPLPLPHIPALTVDKFENFIFKRVVYPALQGVEAIHHPTRTLSAITKRQDAPPAATVTVIQQTNNDNDDDDPTDASTLSGGAIAGIVIGSIAGLLLLIWIFRSCSNLGAPPTDDKPNGKAWYDGVRGEDPPRHIGGVRHSRSRSRHSHHRGHSTHRSHSRRSSMREVPVVVAQPTYVYEDRRGRSGRRSRSRSVSRY